MIIWATMFVFFLQISKVGRTDQYHLAYTMLLGYVHYITIGHLYYKHAYGRVLEVCKQKQRFFFFFFFFFFLVVPNKFDLSSC